MSQDLTFSIGEVTTMIGIPAETLRAWERRHGAIRPGRLPSGQRRYTMDEVDVLKRVKHLRQARGMSIKLAFSDALYGPSETPDMAPVRPSPSGPAESMWRQIADGSPGVVAIIDSQGRIVDCNVPFARLGGEVRDAWRGRRFTDVVAPFDRAKAVALYRPRLEPRSAWELNISTPANVGLFSFDCSLLRAQDDWMLGCIGRRIG